MITIQTQLPDRLWQQAQLFVERGWVSSLDSLLEESLRRYLESHQECINEQFINEDVAWGLHGRN